MEDEVISPVAQKRLEEIHRLSQAYNGRDAKDHAQQLLRLMKEHIEEIEDLALADDPHHLVETGDLLILCCEWLIEHRSSVDEMMQRCFKRYEKKLQGLLESQESRLGE